MERSPFKIFSLIFSNKFVQAPSCERPKTARRTLFLSFANYNCFQISYSVGLRNPFHSIHLIKTTVLYILPDIWDSKNRSSIINLFQIKLQFFAIFWSVGKEPIAMFEFTTWHASFTDFFIKLLRYTAIWKQLFFANDRNRVRGAVLGLSQNGACTEMFENLRGEQLKGRPIECYHFQTTSFLIGQCL